MERVYRVREISKLIEKMRSVRIVKILKSAEHHRNHHQRQVTAPAKQPLAFQFEFFNPLSAASPLSGIQTIRF